MSELVIAGGMVFGPGGMTRADVLVRDGEISEIGTLDATDGTRIDAEGCWVGPGFVDLHAHLREPGQEWKEDIASGSAAAAAGGFTAVLAMPNTDPAIDAGHLARFVIDRGEDAGLVDVVPVGCVTMGREGERLAHLDELWDAGVRMYSDDGDSVADAGILRSAMEYLAARGGVVSQHAEDAGLTRGGHMHEGSVSARLGIGGLPAAAEETVVARDLSLVALTRCRYHAQHVSAAGTVALIREAKAAGLPVTAEVAPHHLVFDHGDVETMHPDFKMYPPLRGEEDREALRRALLDGTIDAVATDHAPHAAHECEVPFEEAPRGVIGLETALGALLTLTADPTVVFDRLSVAPARIAGLEGHGRPLEVGAPAELVVVDPDAETEHRSFRSRSANSPWLGRTLPGAVVATVHRGSITHRREH